MSDPTTMTDSEKWRRFRRMATAFAALIEAKQPKPDDFDYPADFSRASGMVVCETCGLDYFQHPQQADGLFLVCDGSLKHL